MFKRNTLRRLIFVLSFLVTLVFMLTPGIASENKPDSDDSPHTTTHADKKKSYVPVLQPSKTKTMVTITHPELEAAWELRIPEGVSAGGAPVEMLFLPRFNLHSGQQEWRGFPDGSVGYDWKPSKEVVPGEFEVEDITFTFKPGINLSVRLRPSPDRIDITIAITNITDKPLELVCADGGCLRSLTQRFKDEKDYTRTFIKTSQGMIPLSDTKRSSGVRCSYVFSPRWHNPGMPYTQQAAKYWGRSDTFPTSAFVARAAETGGGAIGIGFDQAFRICQNSDSNQCIHSNPYFGTLQPGECKQRKGVILFGNTVAEIFDQFDALGYRPTKSIRRRNDGLIKHLNSLPPNDMEDGL